MKLLERSLLVGVIGGALACSQTERHFADATDAASPTDSEAGAEETDAGSSDAGSDDAGDFAIRCGDDDECDDGNPCNGEEECRDRRCVQGKRLDDGTACSSDPDELLICLRGSCVSSECGDGQLAPYGIEECDDGNARAGDGCENDCTYTCTKDEHCDDHNPCNGEETCDVESHTCVAGDQLDDKTECGDERICSAGRCVPEGCGNSTREEGEDCDDGNLDDGDGCDADCTFTCTEDIDCSDGSVCTGVETCDTESHTCVAGEALDCDDGSACTHNECDPEFGCWNPLIDEDNDGHADEALGACGTDCDDDDATVYDGAAELCDGKDNNCNGDVDETAPVWYRDCDGDGYANASAPTVQQCDEPGPAQGCDPGLAATWTSVAPGPGTTDCWDKDPKVRPRAESDNADAWSAQAIVGRTSDVDFDYNCDGEEEAHFVAENVPADATCSFLQVTPRPYISVEPPLMSYQAPASASGVDSLDASPLGVGIIIPPIVTCVGSAGWRGSAPECGKTATYTSCKLEDGSCVRRSAGQKQECR